MDYFPAALVAGAEDLLEAQGAVVAQVASWAQGVLVRRC